MEKEFKSELKGERIFLRKNKPTIETAKKMFKVIDENREHIKRWLEWEECIIRPEDSLKYLFLKTDGEKNGTEMDYGIYLNDEYIGNIGIFNISKEHRSAEIGYWLSYKYIKKGYMTEAVKTLEKEFFENFNINRIQIVCDEENKASAGVAIKCGYKLEGVTREDLFVKQTGRFRNALTFSKLRFEYIKNK